MLSIFVHELVVFGLIAFVIMTIITAKKESKRSLYGLVALLMCLLVPASHYSHSININSIVNPVIKAVAILTTAVLGRQKGGELMVAQVQTWEMAYIVR